ncbi:unnamed protein product [Oppiella nova]|uniref:RRM domain-containing protein n=1 Tax=Oppiella nova TaxID=334625 RepID=A0A7R9LIA9_9ACAR|nr:unnamed protein product [Oppiella nova]CAG2163807.1 unnamed protein product [Oppiella nova]
MEIMTENSFMKEEAIGSVNGHFEDDSNKDSDIIHTNMNQFEQNDRICNEDNIREPDMDSMKMFVGQIPRDWTETECQKLLEQFGDIHSINLLRDKRTAKSKEQRHWKKLVIESKDLLPFVAIVLGDLEID